MVWEDSEKCADPNDQRKICKLIREHDRVVKRNREMERKKQFKPDKEYVHRQNPYLAEERSLYWDIFNYYSDKHSKEAILSLPKGEKLSRSELNKTVREKTGLLESGLGVSTAERLVKEGNEPPMMQGGIVDDGHEVEMAMSDLHKLEEYAPKVSQLASQYSDLPGWVQSKITLAADYLGKVYHYLDGKQQQGME